VCETKFVVLCANEKSRLSVITSAARRLPGRGGDDVKKYTKPTTKKVGFGAVLAPPF